MGNGFRILISSILIWMGAMLMIAGDRAGFYVFTVSIAVCVFVDAVEEFMMELRKGIKTRSRWDKDEEDE